MENEIQVGDVVTLKSDHERAGKHSVLRMTVASVSSGGTTFCYYVHPVSNDVKHIELPMEILSKV